jgi:hypothetical protein
MCRFWLQDLLSSSSRSEAVAVVWIVAQILVGVVFLDLSAGRLEYHFRLSSELTPIKVEIQKETYAYHGYVPIELQDCQAYDRQRKELVYNCTLSACEENALLLSESRQKILKGVRESYPVSRVVAELFDEARGLDQVRKLETLFQKKSCEQVIESSDRTNWFVDMSAIFLALFSFCVLCKCLFHIIGRFSRTKKIS